MKQYMCVICGFVYDEEQGYPEDNIAPGTKWKMCPQTGSVLTAAPARMISRWSKYKQALQPAAP